MTWRALSVGPYPLSRIVLRAAIARSIALDGASGGGGGSGAESTATAAAAAAAVEAEAEAEASCACMWIPSERDRWSGAYTRSHFSST